METLTGLHIVIHHVHMQQNGRTECHETHMTSNNLTIKLSQNSIGCQGAQRLIIYK